MIFIKKILKAIIYHINLKILWRLIPYPIHKKFFKTDNAKSFENKYLYWDDIVDTLGKDEEVVFIELGVFQGKSLKYFIKKFNNKSSTFFGLDSFKGLPEDYGWFFKKKHFDTQEKIPNINDNRVKFIKGLFQNTSEILLNQLQSIKTKNILVHFDADLYTSTLYCLTQLDRLSRDYYAFFDEFTGEESRALCDYNRCFYSKFKIISHMSGGKHRDWYHGFPHKIFGKIIHRNSSNAHVAPKT
jgi:hypothetical protein